MCVREREGGREGEVLLDFLPSSSSSSFWPLYVNARARPALGLLPRLAGRIDAFLLHDLLELLVVLRDALENQGGSRIAPLGELYFLSNLDADGSKVAHSLLACVFEASQKEQRHYQPSLQVPACIYAQARSHPATFRGWTAVA